MNTFLATAIAFTNLTEKTESWIQIDYPSSSVTQKIASQFDPCSNPQLKDRNQWKDCSPVAIEDLLPDDFILFGLAEDEICQVGIYIGDNQFIEITCEENLADVRIHSLSDPDWGLDIFPYRIALRVNEGIQAVEQAQVPEEKIENLFSIDDQFQLYFVNKQHMPLAISPKESSDLSLSSFQTWAITHQEELRALLATEGALLLRHFPVETAEQFATVIQSIVGRPLMDYRGGEGSRKKVAEGVYTSTEAPPQFHIPLHHELSCSNSPPDYICFYCDIAPTPRSGQTILGKTETITQEIMSRPDIWNFFNGRKIKYISRHPSKGSFFSKINSTHKTWQDAFETNDQEEVERICQAKGLEFQWLGNWIEVTRVVPAIQDPDAYFDHPYWFNQVHLYHANPRLRGGWMNHLLANLLYIIPTTNQYDVQLEDGTPIPREIAYSIYDVLEQNTIKFDWQKGDVLLLDNRRALHGRASYSGQRRILASMIP
jgi:alpha-ketoglutarate-dependent taurine dioxygenase